MTQEIQVLKHIQRYGKITSTLTNSIGEFVLFVPDIDKYIVTINNIFYQNFDLQQNNFEVQLNGYKQFEIAFIFEEKRRRIRFTSDYDYDQNLDVMALDVVRRTNLKGVVKDATNQKPIRALIKIFDKDDRVVSETTSDGRIGLYTLSFTAGNDYQISVSADDYWFFNEKLYARQLTTFQNINKDVLLKSITIGQLIPLNNLIFDQMSSDLSSQATAELDRLLEVLNTNPNVRITIHGHADDLEVLEDSEEDISDARARMVAKYLVANGYSRIEYKGHANSNPVATNDTEADRRKNRRVEIIVKSK